MTPNRHRIGTDSAQTRHTSADIVAGDEGGGQTTPHPIGVGCASRSGRSGHVRRSATLSRRVTRAQPCDGRCEPARSSTSRSSSGPARADGRHEVTTVLQRLDLADDVSVEPAAGARRRRLRRRHARHPRADRARRGGRRRAALRGPDRQADPGRGRASAAAAPTPRPRSCSPTTCSPTPLAPDRLRAVAEPLGADVPFFLEPGPQLGEGDGRDLSPLDLPQDYTVVLVLPARRGEAVDRRRLRRVRRARRRGGLRGAPRRAARRARRGPRAARPRRAPAERPRLLAARRRAPRARRLPRRRHRRRPGRLRALRRARRRRGRRARASSPGAASGSTAPAWYV